MEFLMNRKMFRLPAVLLGVGLLSYVGVTFLHTGGPANDHEIIFGDYARSNDWALVHLAQFAGMAVIVAGLLALHVALDLRMGAGAWLARLGAVSAAVALGLYGVLQAVDGVALKQAVGAWVNAPEADKAARFASAEVVRWLEWGTRSYQSFALGFALILLGAAVATSVRLPRPIGYLMGLSGLAYLVQGWVLGTDGFAAANTAAILSGEVLMLSWIIWLGLVASQVGGGSTRRGGFAESATRPGRIQPGS
jgi:hypothetical protein